MLGLNVLLMKPEIIALSRKRQLKKINIASLPFALLHTTILQKEYLKR